MLAPTLEALFAQPVLARQQPRPTMCCPKSFNTLSSIHSGFFRTCLYATCYDCVDVLCVLTCVHVCLSSFDTLRMARFFPPLAHRKPFTPNRALLGAVHCRVLVPPLLAGLWSWQTNTAWERSM